MSPVTQVPQGNGNTYQTMSPAEVDEADICHRCRKAEHCVARQAIMVEPIKFRVSIVVYSCPDFAVRTQSAEKKRRTYAQPSDEWEKY